MEIKEEEDRFSLRLLPIPPRLFENLRKVYEDKGVAKRKLFAAAINSELGKVVDGLKQLGFARRMPTGKTGLKRVKVDDTTWKKLGEQAEEVGLDRTALLLVCVGRYLKVDIGS